jgi:hypothetical protein
VRCDQAELIEELADVLDLGGKPLALVLPCVVPVMAVVLEHAAAAGDVDEDRIDPVRVKGGDVLVGQLPRRLARPGVEMDRPAAALSLRHDDVATVFLEHAGGRPIGLAKHHVANAAGEQGHARGVCPWRAENRAAAAAASQLRQHRHQPAEPRRQQSPQAGVHDELVEPQHLGDPR